MILRRRFSNQRHNQSTSSSGTGGAINTCSSTDSSIDTSQLSHLYDTESRRSTGGGLLNSPLPRFAISPCKEPHNSGGHVSDLSPVDETGGGLQKKKIGVSAAEQQPMMAVAKKRHSAIVVANNEAVR
jgi:hypothetical protein